MRKGEFIMSDNLTVTNLSVRGNLDAFEEFLGTNGKNAILRYAGLESFIEDPPDYSSEKRIPMDINNRVLWAARVILGNNGYLSMLYQAGIFEIKKLLSGSEQLKEIANKDESPYEKLQSIFDFYSIQLHLEKEDIEYHPDQNLIVIHRKYCSECEMIIKDPKNLEGITRPGCSYVQGNIYGIGNIRPDLVKVERVVEEKCRLLGDRECEFHVTYELQG